MFSNVQIACRIPAFCLSKQATPMRKPLLQISGWYFAQQDRGFLYGSLAPGASRHDVDPLVHTTSQ
jgi:hypothetical protein